MWKSRSVQLTVRLPNELADEAEDVMRSDPEFMSRLIQYGITRRSVYFGIKDQDLRARSQALNSLPVRRQTHASDGVAVTPAAPQM